jgi:hypothetical protein
MQFKEVHTELWQDRIREFDHRLDRDWLCDWAAMNRGYWPGPDTEALKLYLRRDRSTVVVAMQRTAILGYVVGDDDRKTKSELGGRGGCRGRWMGVTDHEPAMLMQGMFDVLCDKYGWIWGRITNPLIQAELLKFGCQPEPNDPTVFTYRKP